MHQHVIEQDLDEILFENLTGKIAKVFTSVDTKNQRIRLRSYLFQRASAGLDYHFQPNHVQFSRKSQMLPLGAFRCLKPPLTRKDSNDVSLRSLDVLPRNRWMPYHRNRCWAFLSGNESVNARYQLKDTSAPVPGR